MNDEDKKELSNFLKLKHYQYGSFKEIYFKVYNDYSRSKESFKIRNNLYYDYEMMYRFLNSNYDPDRDDYLFLYTTLDKFIKINNMVTNMIKLYSYIRDTILEKLSIQWKDDIETYLVEKI